MFPLFRINRAQLLDDALNLGRADLLDYPTALKVTEYLTLETDFIPWSAAVTGLAYLEDMMKRSAGFGELRHYLLATLQPLYDRLGFQEVEGEKFLDEKLRIIMLEVRGGGARVRVTWPRVQVLCRLDHVECNEYSRYLVDQWMSLPNPDTESPIPVSIQGLDMIKH